MAGLYQRPEFSFVLPFLPNSVYDWTGTDRAEQGGRHMGSKDKAGSNTKKKAQHNLKEKRQAKKAKKGGK
jgi:hypothetical protein